MRRLVVGDIHGAYKALEQVFERSKFDFENDQLFCLGDVCDGWPQTKECIDLLLKVKNLVMIIGNHDLWALEWILHDKRPDVWLQQGGKATIRSYKNKKPPKKHIELLEGAFSYYITPDNKLFVHGGFDTSKPIEEQSSEYLIWDRELFYSARDAHREYKFKIPPEELKMTKYNEVFVGHTTTEGFSLVPVNHFEIWNLDQGAGWGGKLSLMDVDTKEYWQSDLVRKLYKMENLE